CKPRRRWRHGVRRSRATCRWCCRAMCSPAACSPKSRSTGSASRVSSSSYFPRSANRVTRPSASCIAFAMPLPPGPKPIASHGHSHGRVDESIKRSREGIRAVALSLAVLGTTAILQTLIYVLTGSVALLADLIHNFGDALTAVPLAIAFWLQSERAERYAGLAVVAAIFISACVAGAEAIDRLVNPNAP